jgi:outer membrane protein assembly factor BamB
VVPASNPLFRLSRVVLGTVVLLLVLTQGPVTASATVPEWTTYHHDNSRNGIDPDSTAPLSPVQAWQSRTLDASIYAEPLVYESHVYVATENNTIYELDAVSGKVQWETHLGAPVPRSLLPCGDIEPIQGITGTPVIDPTTRTIYAVIDTSDRTHAESVHHELVALDLDTGAMRAGFPMRVDPPFPPGGSPVNQLQRVALALDGNEVLIGYGGNSGDCETYWGWLVGAPESGVGPLTVYQADSAPGHDEGAIWGAGNAPAVDAGGDIYAATGNGNSGSEFDFGDSVVKLGPSLGAPLDWWAPADWQELDETDADLGSSDPILLPDGLLFQIGKQGVGVLLRTGALGHTGAPPVAEVSVCGGSWGGGIYVPAGADGGTIYVTCSGGLRAVSVSGLGGAPQLTSSPAWKVPGGAVGPPIFAGGLVWVASYTNEPGVLFGLDPTSGAVRFQENLGSFMHFSTPSAGGGRLFVANGEQVTAFAIATFAPSPTASAVSSSKNPSSAGQSVSFTATVSPNPDGGTVGFADDSVPIPGCATVAANRLTGQASCRTTYTAGGTHSVVASYSGDAFFQASRSAAFAQVVKPGPKTGPRARVAVSRLRESHRIWREGRALARTSRRRHPRPPVGTTFSFSLSGSATVTLRFDRQTIGHRAGHLCLAGSHGKHARRRCRRLIPEGGLTFAGHGAVNRVRFDGRLSARRKLVPGHYELVLTATNASGASVPQAIGFTIVC